MTHLLSGGLLAASMLLGQAGDAPKTVVPPPPTLQPMQPTQPTRPILGWMGVVDERVDYAMVGEMARMRPDWSFAMVGPVVKVDPNLLPHAPNLYWMGGRDYLQMPNYCAAFDFCMMPFAMNASTQYINPTKGLEYMATGRPIISTPVKDVVRQWSDICYIVRNAEEFVAAADAWLRNPDHARLRRGLELAKKCSWEGTVKSMQEARDAATTGTHCIEKSLLRALRIRIRIVALVPVDITATLHLAHGRSHRVQPKVKSVEDPRAVISDTDIRDRDSSTENLIAAIPAGWTHR